MRTLVKIDAWLGGIAMSAAKILYVAMGVSVFLQIAFRYLFHIGLNWVDELSRFLLVWVVFLGGGSAIGNVEGTCVGFIKDALPANWRKALRFAFRLLILTLLAVMVETGLAFAEYGKGTRTVALWGFTLFLPHLAIPVGSAVMIFRWLVVLLRDLFPDAAGAGEEGTA